MVEVLKDFQGLGNDPVAVRALDMGDKAHSARVMLVSGIVQPLRPRECHCRNPSCHCAKTRRFARADAQIPGFQQLSATDPTARSSENCAMNPHDDRKLFLQLRKKQERLGRGQALLSIGIVGERGAGLATGARFGPWDGRDPVIRTTVHRRGERDRTTAPPRRCDRRRS